jgi:hypothetical protein
MVSRVRAVMIAVVNVLFAYISEDELVASLELCLGVYKNDICTARSPVV